MIAALLAAAAVGGTPVPVPVEKARGVSLAIVARGLDQPVALAFAPADPARRIFVAEKTGKIRVLKDGRLLEAPFVDLSARVSKGSEQGLLGLAFHPGYARNGRMFVNYTDREGDTRVVELTVGTPAADVATIARERALLRVEQPYSNHNGGHLVVGKDGALLIGLGDGGSGGDPQGNAQNPRSLLGKMLRLDPDAAEPRAVVLAKGLRNPWRYAIDDASGMLYIADVGQHKWEEIHVIPLAELNGANFGWNRLEGSHCFKTADCSTSGMVAPVAEYDHDAGCSITGGVVYRGAALSALAGMYFYADYCTALLRSFRYLPASRSIVDHWDWKAALDPKNRLSQVSSFGEDEAREVYVLSLSGSIFKLVPASP